MLGLPCMHLKIITQFLFVLELNNVPHKNAKFSHYVPFYFAVFCFEIFEMPNIIYYEQDFVFASRLVRER